jgi:hypothetical protein
MTEVPIDVLGRRRIFVRHLVEMHVWCILIEACHISIKIFLEPHKMELMMGSLGYKLSKKVSNLRTQSRLSCVCAAKIKTNSIAGHRMQIPIPESSCKRSLQIRGCVVCEAKRGSQ